MQQQSTISLWCERIIEIGWLIALSLIPIYFNLLSARHFEPDKATSLRAIVLIMAAAALVRALEGLNRRTPTSAPTARSNTEANDSADPPAASNPFATVWAQLNRVPLIVPSLFFGLVFIITTITSVVPHTSFWGSYQRLQGTYTNLSYIVLFVIIVATLRRRAQFERIITVSIVTCFAVASYGILQHFQLDPLPWQGDVITRVASTMGNSIFVAAYMIMIVPLGLYRLIVQLNNARHAPASDNPGNDLLWALAHGLLIFGTLALLLSIIKLTAVVRTIDFRYWWVFPGAIIASTFLWTLINHRPKAGQTRNVPIWPGVFFLLYMISFGLIFAMSSGTGAQILEESVTNAQDWWIWLLGSFAAVGAFYVLALLLPTRSGPPTRLSLSLGAAALLVMLFVTVLAVVFTQSRGPQLGFLAGMFVFFMLLMWQAARRARQLEQRRLLRWMQGGMGLTSLAAVAGIAFLLVFNLSDAPVFNQLRAMPYIGRMGTLLETSYGTGLVRRLIWLGDEHAGGAAELITDNPVRTVVGWGPESMFVAYNTYYPPALAQVESRGASPDRSHQAILDELVTKGFLGLISYLFVIFSFYALAWRLMRQSESWQWQVFAIAVIAAITCHLVEGVTGIPVVSTLMMVWVTLGITVSAGMLAGLYPIGATSTATPSPEAPATAAASEPTAGKGSNGSNGGKGREGKRGRRKQKAREAAPTPARASTRSQTSPVALVLYGFIFVLALFSVWWFNLSTIYADMRFHEGQAFSQGQGDYQQQIIGLDRYIAAITHNPREDYYYLSLGRSLMNVADQKRAQGQQVGTPEPEADVQDLTTLPEITAVTEFAQGHTPLELLSYAEAVLLRAHELNPMNKDHYANLARLNNFWYNWTQEPERMNQTLAWYERANEVAPQDVTLLNEHARVAMQFAGTAASQGNDETWSELVDRADRLLDRSVTLDESYFDTTVQIAELARVRGEIERSVDAYVEVIARDTGRVTPHIEVLLASYASEPEQIMRLYDAYMEQAAETNDAQLYSIAGIIAVRAGNMEQAIEPYRMATELAPDAIDHRLNYSIVLSDTDQFSAALAEAETGLSLANSQQGQETAVNQFEYLISILQPKVAGGQ